jgi:hypothetical protein
MTRKINFHPRFAAFLALAFFLLGNGCMSGEMMDKAKRDALTVATRARIKGLDVGMNIYRSEKDKWPPTGNAALVAALREVQFDFKDDALDADGRVIDTWKHPLIYVAPGKIHPGGVDLYSCGPDGKDDGGGGDDIVNP